MIDFSSILYRLFFKAVVTIQVPLSCRLRRPLKPGACERGLDLAPSKLARAPAMGLASPGTLF
jgi:hypothetical protein